jgi:hypothetical protein
MSELAAHQALLDGWTPWAGLVPVGFVADFMGILTDIKFCPMSGLAPSDVGGGWVQTAPPQLGDGGNAEVWFETVNCLATARDARDGFVMMTLGAHYGAQAVGAHQALRRLNPLPCKLVVVEPEPENFAWMVQHLRNNGIDPAAHWLLPLALSDSNAPAFFPIGAPGTGANNCLATNEAAARQSYADEILAAGATEAALRSLLLSNSTGILRPVHPDLSHMTEVKCVSAVTLADLVGPFDRVDLIESDIQQSEILVFPPWIDLLRRKVRRIAIGTHGLDTHLALHRLFEQKGWTILFSFAPNSRHESALGSFTLNDGVLTVTNPDL